MKRYLVAVALILLLTLTACSTGPKEVTDMVYSAEICGEKLDGTYTGTVVDDLPNGAGTFTVENSKKTLTYTGQWENGSIVGIGELEYDGYVLEYNDTEYTGIYSGQAENGMPSGEGSFDGEKRDKYLVYEGNWKDGAFAGEGYLEANEYRIFMSEDAERYGEYVGEVLDGIPSGEGSYTTKNDKGITYTHKGEWKNGKCNGYGERIFEADNYYMRIGNFVNGEFCPNPLEFFTALGTNDGDEYTISEKAKTFLKENPEVFTDNNPEGFEIDKKFGFKEFSKNSEESGDSLITVSMTVVQIWEKEYFGIPGTFCLGRDGNRNYYYMFMYNSTENINVNNWVKATVLPLDYFTYTTTANTQNWAMAAAAVTITK